MTVWTRVLTTLPHLPPDKFRCGDGANLPCVWHNDDMAVLGATGL